MTDPVLHIVHTIRPGGIRDKLAKAGVGAAGASGGFSVDTVALS